jgi:hypothetical protein
MSYKSYASKVTLEPQEKLKVEFPWGYFKNTPTLNVSSNMNSSPDILTVNKKYFIIFNNTNVRVVYHYVAILHSE